MGKSITFKYQGQVNTDFNDLPVASFIIRTTDRGKSTSFEARQSQTLTSALLTSGMIQGTLLPLSELSFPIYGGGCDNYIR